MKLMCDHCGTRNPETFEGRRLTKCCAVKEKSKGCYRVEENGVTYYALGKTWEVPTSL